MDRHIRSCRSASRSGVHRRRGLSWRRARTSCPGRSRIHAAHMGRKCVIHHRRHAPFGRQVGLEAIEQRADRFLASASRSSRWYCRSIRSRSRRSCSILGHSAWLGYRRRGVGRIALGLGLHPRRVSSRAGGLRRRLPGFPRGLRVIRRRRLALSIAEFVGKVLPTASFAPCQALPAAASPAIRVYLSLLLLRFSSIRRRASCRLRSGKRRRTGAARTWAREPKLKASARGSYLDGRPRDAPSFERRRVPSGFAIVSSPNTAGPMPGHALPCHDSRPVWTDPRPHVRAGIPCLAAPSPAMACRARPCPA